MRLPVIANGGFQRRSAMESALTSGDCDMISMARSLIANPDLLRQFEGGADFPVNPCNYCNKCVGKTGTSPLGCYDIRRFKSQGEMFNQIMEWNRPDPVLPETVPNALAAAAIRRSSGSAG